MAGKDFRAAFSNMNQAVRPGNEQPVVKKKKMSLAEKRALCMVFRLICPMKTMSSLCSLRSRQKRVVKRFCVML